MAEKAASSSDYVFTIEFLLKKMIDPGEDFPADEKPVLKVDEFKEIFWLVNKPTIEGYLSGQSLEYSLDVLTFLKSLKQTAYYIVEEKVAKDLYQRSSDYLKELVVKGDKTVSEMLGITLEIYLSLQEYFKQ